MYIFFMCLSEMKAPGRAAPHGWLLLESLSKACHGSLHELRPLRGPKGLTNRNSFCSARTKIRGPISRHHYSLRDGLRQLIVSTEGHIPDPFSP